MYLREDHSIPVPTVKIEPFSTYPKSLITEYKKVNDSFENSVRRYKYLWRQPKDTEVSPYITSGGEALVKDDDNHLSDKEEFLLKFLGWSR